MPLHSWARIAIFALTLAATAACTTRDFGADDHRDDPVAVSFDSYMQRPQSGTRAQQTGTMDDATLQATGFGVFALHHTDADGSNGFDLAGEGASTGFNFMYNEHLTHSGTAWTYSPLKYWPNDNADADADEGTATGSLSHHYVSFFAYAPYADLTSPPADGITDISANNTQSGSAAITYHTSTAQPFSPAESVDLLWAEQRDLYKTKATGEGYVSGTVRLPFKHALSKLYISVQGLFDHTSNDDTSVYYDDDIDDAHSRLLIESISFAGSPIYSQADLFLASDGSTPRWGNYAYPDNLVLDQKVVASLSNNYGSAQKVWDPTKAWKRFNTYTTNNETLTTAYADAAEAEAALADMPDGVTHTEQPLTGNADDYLLLIPTTGTAERMTVTMVYYVITYDPRLTMNTPRYFSVVRNEVTYAFDSSFTLEPNKSYKLLLQPGLTTVKFSLTVGETWDSPIMLNPVVIDWYTTVAASFNVE